ncbi:hypothetical protein F2Q70_00008216 [Brassica cretica]|uniref:Small ribosomal subunit protein uS3 C-terminal domain-containing protein n=1 Tax=Brassica cretica TaxID=69181 RepID=A0A8S9M173_BRACR|nr:hypothetical protein F2Q70_00008216 [Brassica cretica]
MGARIPNIKPGKATIEYLTKIQASTRFWGGLLLSFLATSSSVLDHYLRSINQGFSIGFTSVLIIASVGSIIELRRSYHAYNVMPSLSKALKRLARAKSMKFKDGYMVSSGQPTKDYIDSAVRHVLLRQGVLGIKVKVMLDWDPKGINGPKTPLPDVVIIHAPKEEDVNSAPAQVAAPAALTPEATLTAVDYPEMIPVA